MPPAIADTSIFIAQETGRSLGPLPDQVAVSVVTLAELEAGVLAAKGIDARAQRLRTLMLVREHCAPLPIDERVASAFAGLRAHLNEHGRRVNVQDLWIAATGRALGAAIWTQDGDFEDLPGVDVIRVCTRVAPGKL
jgi:predicted nucleic acid-binding protein